MNSVYVNRMNMLSFYNWISPSQSSEAHIIWLVKFDENYSFEWKCDLESRLEDNSVADLLHFDCLSHLMCNLATLHRLEKRIWSNVNMENWAGDKNGLK